MTTAFYTDQPVCIDLFCHTGESRTFAGDSNFRLTVIVANECVLIIRKCFLCLPCRFHPDTVNRRYGIAGRRRTSSRKFDCIHMYRDISIAAGLQKQSMASQ